MFSIIKKSTCQSDFLKNQWLGLYHSQFWASFTSWFIFLALITYQRRFALQGFAKLVWRSCLFIHVSPQVYIFWLSLPLQPFFQLRESSSFFNNIIAWQIFNVSRILSCFISFHHIPLLFRVKLSISVQLLEFLTLPVRKLSESIQYCVTCFPFPLCAVYPALLHQCEISRTYSALWQWHLGASLWCIYCSLSQAAWLLVRNS